MKFSTSLTQIRKGEEFVRGVPLGELIQKKTFAETIFLLLAGKMPSKKETMMLDALLTSAIDHGPGTASAMTARIVASTKNSLHTAVAAGILAMGERHGSAIEGAARFFQENAENKELEKLIKELKEKKIRLAGYGHAVLDKDQRAEMLLAVARKNGFFGKHCACAEATGKILNSISSKQLPLNIDGAMGAVLSDMGFSWPIMKGFFIVARTPGLVAQAYEEMAEDTGMKRLEESEIEYR